MKPKPPVHSYPPDTITCTAQVQKLTARQFKNRVRSNPAWASELTAPVEIITYCNMSESGITHLSPLLIFSGRNDEGTVASFLSCKDLRVAAGTYHGRVCFHDCGIEGIKILNITRPNDEGEAASFICCKALRIAKGRFAGLVGFYGCGIQEIGELEILRSHNDGTAADFFLCDHLRVARGCYPGRVNFNTTAVESIADLVVRGRCEEGIAASFEECKNLRVARGRYPGLVTFDGSSVTTISDDFEVPASPADSCAIPQASFVGCRMRWGSMSRMCLRKIVQHRYIGIWEEAAANLDAQLRAIEALRDPGIEL